MGQEFRRVLAQRSEAGRFDPDHRDALSESSIAAFPVSGLKCWVKVSTHTSTRPFPEAGGTALGRAAGPPA
jgi:hypothetical protein